MTRQAGEQLPKPCVSDEHGWRVPPGFSGVPERVYSRHEHDPRCQTCVARAILAEHTHLHLDFSEPPCMTPGLRGVAGQMVECSCGAYHH